MKKRLLFLTAVAFGLFVCVLSATAGGQKESGATSTAAAQPVTISYWFPTADPVSDAYYSGVATDFMAKNPGIKIDITKVPSNPSDIDTKLNAALLSGTFPDVFLAYLVFIGTRGSHGDFASLNSFIDNWSQKSDLFSSALEMGKYKDQYLGVGFAPSPDILTYRKDYFQEAGLDPNKPPTTWEQLASDALKLTQRDSQGNVIRAGLDMPALSPALVFVEPFMRQNGCKVIDEVKQVPAFDTPQCAQALQYLADLYQKKESIPYNFQQLSTSPFVSGRAAMAYLTPDVIQGMIQTDPTMEAKLGFAPVMSRTDKVAFCGYRLWTIGASSKHKDAAWKFIEYLMSSEQVWKRYTDLKVPVVLNSLKQKFVADNPSFNNILVDYVEYGKGKAVVPWTGLANKYMALAYQQAITGKMSAAQALHVAQTGLENELKQGQ